MFFSRRRLVLIGIVATIVGVIVFLPLILTITLPDINKIAITVNKIEFKGISEKNNTAKLDLSFNFNNPTSQAITTSKIDYKLSANGKTLGDYFVSYEDIPLNGRPQIIPDRDTVIRSVIDVPLTDENFAKLLKANNQTLQNIDWTINGTSIIESGFSSSPKAFNTKY